jgi:predicted transcriptional regulator
MSDELDKLVGPLEAEVLRVLWAATGPLGVREVLDRLNRRRKQPLAYTTVMTVLSRLAEKEILARELRGRGYVYEPTARDAAEIAVRNVVRDFGDAAVSHFLTEARSDPELLHRLQRLMGEKR